MCSSLFAAVHSFQMTTFIKILLTWCVFGVVGCKEIYVSRYHGNNLPSCGKTIKTACKAIVFATTQAQWNDTIYIDGTETSRDPYPCSSMASYPAGIYINKSLSFERFGKEEVFLKCSSARQMMFDGRNVTEKVIIRFVGLTFVNSLVTVQKCSLYVESSLFKDAISLPNAAAVVDFESFEENFSLTIRKSTFSNNGLPCIRVVGSRCPNIDVYDTAFINNTAIGANTTYDEFDVAVFMVLLPTQHVGCPGTTVTLTNTSFIRNTAPSGGCLYIFKTGDKQIKSQRNSNSTKDASIVSQRFCSTKHGNWKLTARGHVYVGVNDGFFSSNVGRAITSISIGTDVSICITRSDFINNSSPVGGAILVKGDEKLLLEIESSTFAENSAQSDGSAVYLGLVSYPSQVVSVLIRDVLFLGNVIVEEHNPYHTGGALTVTIPYGNLTVLLHNVSFMYNKASKGCSTLLADGYFLDITMIDSSFLGNSQNEGFSSDWKIFQIVSTLLKFDLIRTIISGNIAGTPSALMNTNNQVIVTARDQAKVNISGLHYIKNKGGGIYIQLSEASQSFNGSTFLLEDSYFENNEFFFFLLETMTIMTLLQMKRFAFRGNTFVSSFYSSGVQMFSLYVVSQENQITMEDAKFENNTVKGAIAQFAFFPDEMHPDTCNTPDVFSKNHVRVTRVLFYKNNPINSTVLRLEKGQNILNNCRFVDNFAVYTIFTGPSCTDIELINTSFEKTPQWSKADSEVMFPSGFRGFIFYASGGPIKLKNTTLKAETFQDIDAYFMVIGSYSTDIDDSTVIQCPTGTLRTLINFTHPRENAPLYHFTSQSFVFSCKRCSPGLYSVEPFGERCRPCPYGGNCTGYIAAKPTFWGYPSLSDHGSVTFRQCPIDYCCPYQNISCSYDNQRYLSNGCSGNRTGTLCGACKSGFTETLFSARCRESNDCTDYWFWPVALFYSFAFAFFLLWKTSIICFIKRLLPWVRPQQVGHSAGDLASNGGGYVKVIFYFYQVASLVFVSKDTELHLAENYLLLPVVGLFDFKAISSNEGLVCPCRGLTVVSKMFLQASQVFAVLSGIMVIFLVHGAVRKFQKQSPVFLPSGQYLAAITECFLLGYSTLARTALKALNCVPIQTTSRFFYDGNIRCWQWWQKLCGVYIFVFIIPFVFILYRGSKLLHGKAISTKQFLYACLFPLPFAFCWMVSCRKISPNETETHHASDEQLPLLPPDRSTIEPSFREPTADVIYGPFKTCDDNQDSGAVYWESVLIGRRLVLISLHTFIVFPFIRMVCLSVTCAGILAHHMWKKPFKDIRVNNGETASLTALLVLAVINMAEVTFAINGETPSEQERICLMVLHVVEVIILGTVPVVFALIIVVSVIWHLLNFCKFCCIAICRVFVIN